ncbi:MAG: efflux RND transporter permease subunit [Cryomorphaceae bacterium]|nr:MAG: efflux RND transporter permease subunit [Cryomorphaceae bacterium]
MNLQPKHTKEFGLSSAAVNNRTTVLVLVVFIFLAGLIAYTNMSKESFPEVVIPEIYVGTPYPGNSPLDIEKLITRPIEKEINTISGVDEINSTSIQGHSSIQVKFDFSVSPEEALRKVKDKVDVAKSDSDFPQDLPADPNVFELNISEMMPIMNINLSGDYSVDQLNSYAEYLEEKIENLPEITEVEIRGVTDKEVAISLDLHKMEAMQISFYDVSQAISDENVTISGGDVLIGDFRRNVRVVGDFAHMDDIRNTVVKREKGNIVYLKDIAEVTFGEKERESYARDYLNPVVMVDVKKRAGENLLEASDKIRDIVAYAQAHVFPDDLKVSITNDQSNSTRNQLDELENSILFGMMLVVGVLLFFLGLRNAAFVGIAIPMSMLMAFMLLGALGVTLNMIVLFSLILALGMLVDNGIVVVENIYRLMDEGQSPMQAAKNGVGEVAWPIIASTATTLAAFLPLAFWPGVMGEFMFYLPITLMIVLGSSLFVALVINPVLTSLFMKVGEPQVNRKKILRNGAVLMVVGLAIAISAHLNGMEPLTTLGNLLVVIGLMGYANIFVLNPGTTFFQTRLIPAMEQRYEAFLKRALKGINPVLYFVGTFLMLILSGVLFGFFPPKVIFFPENEPQYLNIFIENPIGTDIEPTNEIAYQVEQEVIEIISKYIVQDEPGKPHNFLVESVIGQVGKGTSDPAQGQSFGNTPHKARVSVQFVESQFRRGIGTNDVMTEIREALRDIPGTQITVSKNSMGPPQGLPINIEIAGDDYTELMAHAQGVRRFINEAGVAGIEELKLDVDDGQPEMPVRIDRDKARRLNLSTAQIGNAIRTALYGMEVSTFKDGEDDYEINIRLAERYRRSPDALLNQRITFRDQSDGQIKQIPVSSVATADFTSTFSAVKRKDLNRVITISSNVLDGFNANEVVQNIRNILADYNLPPDITLKFTGQQEEQAKEMEFLSIALFIAFFLIILIIVAQFNSISAPFIIGFSVIFSLIGVQLGLVGTGMDFVVVMTMVGIISLAGIVVNNAIVLLDYTNLIRTRRREDLGLENRGDLPFAEVFNAVIQGGKTRLRPVVLTAITTILGLLPLAMGININFFSFFSRYDAQFYIGGDNVMFWGPMSWTIIFGLTFATFLTLVIVPVMYLILARIKYRVVYKKSTKV